MLIRPLCIVAILAVCGCSTQPPETHEGPIVPAERPVASVSEVATEVERIASERALWPGFDPRVIPLALYDGERTYLYRHPSPPEGFALVEGATPPAHAYPGRFPAVTSNTSAEIGGTLTATLMMDGPRARRRAADLAATALHEAFHVYQRTRHPSWQANEGDLLLYPIDDLPLLALRRLETEALRRAVVAADAEAEAARAADTTTRARGVAATPTAAAAHPEADAGSAACWARRALALRRERFARMEAPFPLYERKTELNEGLATYVEMKAAGRPSPSLEPGGFKAAGVRGRAYAVGAALALLLDHVRPDWREALEADRTKTLDGILDTALESDPVLARALCQFSDAETAAADTAAAADIEALLAERLERRRLFDRRPGWRVIVSVAGGEPLWPQQFDPLNVERIDGGVLHTRLLSLGNIAGHLEALDVEGADIETLTEGVGPHPFFQGIQRAEIAGLDPPKVTNAGNTVTVHAPGFEASFKPARLEQEGTLIRITLGSDTP